MSVFWQTSPFLPSEEISKILIESMLELKQLLGGNIAYNEQEKTFSGDSWDEKAVEILTKYYDFSGIDGSLNIGITEIIDNRIVSNVVRTYLSDGTFYSEMVLQKPKNEFFVRIDSNHPFTKKRTINEMSCILERIIKTSVLDHGVQAVIKEYLDGIAQPSAEKLAPIEIFSLEELINERNENDEVDFFLRIEY